MLFSFIVMMCSCYWQAAPSIARLPMNETMEKFLINLNRSMLLYKDYFSHPIKVKLFSAILFGASSAFRLGKKVESKWSEILLISGIGLLIFFISPKNPLMYFMSVAVGMGMSIYGLSLVFRKLKDDETAPDEEEGFDQNTTLINTKDSINIPYTFIRKGKKVKGWINCINPYRASAVLGSPGSGKSFAIYNAFIEQQIRKGFTIFLYDYKFPDLTERVLTEIAYQRKYEKLWEDTKKMPKLPHLYIINFDDPLKSNRCNPIHHSYITDPADTTEIADLVFKNINKGSDGKGFDFFNESAKVYLDALVWLLANYDPKAVYNTVEGLQWVRTHRGLDAYDAIPENVRQKCDGMTVIDSENDYQDKGKLCTFPHVIELMAYNYEKVFQILQFTKGLEAKISPFSSALDGGAMEQLLGQIASAQIPMGKFVSPALYWVMTGDDFTLDINNPEDPKIVCMGNNPDRQSIYGTTLALYTSRMFKLINHKHKLPSAVLLDELPTVFIKGLDNLIATARSNKVAITFGAQDESQLRRDYGDKEAEVIMKTVGNLFSGSVEGRTGENISKSFGKEYRKRVSQSIGEDSDSRSISYQLEDILPASVIMDMTQGTFCGWVKDNFGETIKRKKFYGAVDVDMERNKRLDENFQGVPVITKMFGDETPKMTAYDKTRLSKNYPNLAEDEKKLYDIFLKEKVKAEADKNFNRIKNDIEEFVEKEFLRTTPMAILKKQEKENRENG